MARTTHLPFTTARLQTVLFQQTQMDSTRSSKFGLAVFFTSDLLYIHRRHCSRHSGTLSQIPLLKQRMALPGPRWMPVESYAPPSGHHLGSCQGRNTANYGRDGQAASRRTYDYLTGTMRVSQEPHNRVTDVVLRFDAHESSAAISRRADAPRTRRWMGARLRCPNSPAGNRQRSRRRRTGETALAGTEAKRIHQQGRVVPHVRIAV